MSSGSTFLLVERVLCPLTVCSPLSLTTTLSPERAALGQEVLSCVFSVSQAVAAAVLTQVKVTYCFSCATSLSACMDCSQPLRCHSGSELVLFITTKHSFWLLQPLSSRGAVLQCKRGWSKCLALAGVHVRAVEGNQTKSCAVSICFLHLVSAGRKCVQVLHEQSLSL